MEVWRRRRNRSRDHLTTRDLTCLKVSWNLNGKEPRNRVAIFKRLMLSLASFHAMLISIYMLLNLSLEEKIAQCWCNSFCIFLLEVPIISLDSHREIRQNIKGCVPSVKIFQKIYERPFLYWRLNQLCCLTFNLFSFPFFLLYLNSFFHRCEIIYFYKYWNHRTSQVFKFFSCLV